MSQMVQGKYFEEEKQQAMCRTPKMTIIERRDEEVSIQKGGLNRILSSSLGLYAGPD